MPPPVEEKKKKGKKVKNEAADVVEDLKNNLDKLELDEEEGKKQNKKGMPSNYSFTLYLFLLCLFRNFSVRWHRLIFAPPRGGEGG